MIFCLGCRHVSPAGSVYCGYCARSLNQTFCGNGHANAPGVLCCTTCGSPQLSDYARGIRLGWVGSVVGGVLLLFVWKGVLPYWGTIACFLFQAATIATAFAFNTRAVCVRSLLNEALSLTMFLCLMGYFLHFLPGGGGAICKWLRSIPAQIGRLIRVCLPRLGGWILRGIRRLF